MGGTYLSLNETQRDHKEANVHLFVCINIENVTYTLKVFFSIKECLAGDIHQYTLPLVMIFMLI